MSTPDQMREVLTNQYGYLLESIPLSLGGLLDPTLNGDSRYQMCLAIVTNSESICYSYYSPDYQPITAKSTSNILFFNTDHHHQQKQDTTSSSTTPRTSSPTSLVAIVALRRNHESQARVRKRESSSSTDSEKRRRSNDSIIEEEPPTINSLTYIPQEIPFE
jgi:hypothetical protein